jgi:hypothetical protein
LNGLSHECAIPNHVGGLEAQEKGYDDSPCAKALAGLCLLLFPIFRCYDCTPGMIHLTGAGWQVSGVHGREKTHKAQISCGAADPNLFERMNWTAASQNSQPENPYRSWRNLMEIHALAVPAVGPL